MDKIIKFAKNTRKQKHLSLNYSTKYAFVGIGGHSMDNLYPVLNYLRVPIKYIVTKGTKNATTIDENFDGIIGTSDLKLVLNDPEIKGVFVCADPNAHFSLAKEILNAGKSVFIEKPPCRTIIELRELIGLETKANGFSMVGVQRRYAPCYSLLKKKIEQPISYQLNYQTGAFPEGDILTELFIHPIDLTQYLFGPAEVTSMVKTESKKGCITYLIHLSHDSLVGSLELSTDYTWSRATEQLSVNTAAGCFKTSNAEGLSFDDKLGSILKVPKEKVFGHQPTSKSLIHSNSFLPIWEQNPLYTAGFFNEISAFVERCEGWSEEGRSSFADLESTYVLIEKMRN
jgi:virulence factor